MRIVTLLSGVMVCAGLLVMAGCGGGGETGTPESGEPAESTDGSGTKPEEGSSSNPEGSGANAEDAAGDTGPVLQFTANRIDGTEVNMADYKGRVLLVVNVASKCGFTKQYEGLQALHEKYADKGLSVLGFPCNQFRGQEPGTSEEIMAFCKENYGVEFDMFDKIEVNGDGAAPLYAYLTGDDMPVEDKGEVKWNFEKFLVDKEGNVIARFRSKVEPESEEMVKAIEAALAET